MEWSAAGAGHGVGADAVAHERRAGLRGVDRRGGGGRGAGAAGLGLVLVARATSMGWQTLVMLSE